MRAGLYLRDLSITCELPTFLDPTAPSAPASVDEVTGEFEAIHDDAAFADLPPLPSSVTLHPLVNVHKHRTIASIVQKILVFQEMAGLYPYEADATLFRKCLGLRTLHPDALMAASLRAEPI